MLVCAIHLISWRCEGSYIRFYDTQEFNSILTPLRFGTFCCWYFVVIINASCGSSSRFFSRPIFFLEINSNFPVLVCCVFIFISFGYHRRKSPKTYRKTCVQKKTQQQQQQQTLIVSCVPHTCIVHTQWRCTHCTAPQFISFPFVNPCSLSSFLAAAAAVQLKCSISTAAKYWQPHTMR